MARRILKALCILSCVLFVASASDKNAGRRSPVNREDTTYNINNENENEHNRAARADIIPERHDKRDYGNSGYGGEGYGNQGGGGGTQNNTSGQGGGGRNNQTALEVLSNRNGTEFCSQYLQMMTTTVTSTVSPTLATTVETSSITTDLGTVVVGTVTQTTLTLPTTTGTTETLTTTVISSTSVIVTTATTFTNTPLTAIPPPPNRKRAHAAAAAAAAADRKRMQTVPRKRDELPQWLQPFNETEVSAACSELVAPQTQLHTATTTVTVPQTSTQVTFTTSEIPAVTSTSVTTLIQTTMPIITTTTLTTVPTLTTTTSTALATATECAQSSPFASVAAAPPQTGFVQQMGTNGFTACCSLCFASPTTNCGFFYVDDTGCYIAEGSQNPPGGTGQCALGTGDYTVTTGVGKFGSPGPCAASIERTP